MQSNTFSGLFVGQKIITLKRVTSTNDFLKKELSKSTPLLEGTAIMAEEQYAGRGQAGNQWFAEPGKNLTFSVLLNPTFLKPEEQFGLNMVVSNAVCKVLQAILPAKVSIKWPNDILVEGRKIGGILIENILQGSVFKHSIVGIGINVNQEMFPNEVKNVTSIKQILQDTYSKQKLLYDICQSIGQQYAQLKANQMESLKAFYLCNLFAVEELRLFEVDGVRVKGRIVDVTPWGRLVLDFEGYRADFGFKEIAFLI